MTDKELLKKALHRIEYHYEGDPDDKEAIEAIKARLAQCDAGEICLGCKVCPDTQPEPTVDGWPLYSGLPQPEPEPIAEVGIWDNGQLHITFLPASDYLQHGDKLYTAPPQRKQTDAVSEQYAHRLAIMLECMVLSPNKTWNEANDLISEYHEALQIERINAGEPYVSGFGKD